MISSVLYTLIGLFAVAFLVASALSPIETLSWWAGWTEDELDEDDGVHANESDTAGASHTPADKHFIVYLSGIASISGRYLIPREKAFIKGLRRNYPDAVIIDNVFPYSPSGNHLIADPRTFERFWRWLQKLKLQGRRSILSVLINFRNLYQVMISADHRYGPIYNQGAARVIEDALISAGYDRSSGLPVTIIGYSGGGQIALGATTFLRASLNAPIDIISIGGVVASDPGLHALRRFHYVYGGGDNIRRLGAIMFPERWPVMAHSEWNAAKRDGRLVLHRMKKMFHAGPRGYFGLPKRDGVSNNERTLAKVLDIMGESAP